MLKITNLYKKYKKNSYYSVNDLSLEIKESEIVGFLGKNGAGKSTTLKCIVGAIPFDDGTITINDYDVTKEPIKTKNLIGFVSDQSTAYENLTGKEYINFIGNVYFIPLDVLTTRLEKCVKEFNMEHLINKPISTYSLGYKQLISIIALFVRNPSFWILDEPTVSLEAEFADKIEKLMLNAKKEGKIIFFSSHYIELLERVCDKVAIIKGGTILEVVDLKQLKKDKTTNLKKYYLKITKG
jgi:ABC-2 type transport system ATP-binding protein